MTHHALICPPFHSHVRAFEAIGEALLRRGHAVSFLLNAGGGALVEAGGFGVEEVGAVRTPCRSPGRNPAGLFGILRTVRASADRTRALCDGGPEILRRIGAEIVLADQMEPAGGLLAEHLRLPFLSVAAALPIDPHPSLPSPFLGWSYDPSPEGLKRNRGGERVSRLLLHRQREAIQSAAQRFGLRSRSRLEECLSPLATIAQTVPGFDFPRPPSPRHFAVGPFRAAGAPEAAGFSLPFARRAGVPLVFCSLGTLQGHRLSIFHTVARACRRLGWHLVVAHCGRLSPEQAATIDADLVTDFLPQRAMLALADLCISHGGLNTALDAMEAGVPVLAIPIAYDQPGVAARLLHHGAGLRLARRRLDVDDVVAALRRLHGEPRFAVRAHAIGAEIREAGGVERAADLVERFAAGASRPRELALA
ncbi:MAG: nucleotide disphospho-sugar-binding domain-containing protein [Methylobacterium sp.]